MKKEDDQILVKKSVIRRTFKSASGKERTKCTKIQRLITPERLRRKTVYAVKIFIFYTFFLLFFYTFKG